MALAALLAAVQLFAAVCSCLQLCLQLCLQPCRLPALLRLNSSCVLVAVQHSGVNPCPIVVNTCWYQLAMSSVLLAVSSTSDLLLLLLLLQAHGDGAQLRHHGRQPPADSGRAALLPDLAPGRLRGDVLALLAVQVPHRQALPAPLLLEVLLAGAHLALRHPHRDAGLLRR